MKIKDIYKKFKIIPNLKDHMITVTKFGLVLEKHWKGEELDWNKLKIISLLHDLGNIVKFDLDKFPQFLGKESKRIDYWKKIQAQIIEKYGKDDHKATKKMLEEIKVDKFIINTILEKSFGNSIKIASSDNWYLKILSYCDARVMPQGIVTLNERIQDVKARMPKYSQRNDFPELILAVKNIEKQIQENVDIFVEEINNNSIKEIEEDLLETYGFQTFPNC